MFRYFAYFFPFLARLILFPAWLLSGFVPRRRELWVFGSWGGHRFADNAAAFFRYCHEYLDGRVELVWISRDPAIVAEVRRLGYTAHLIWSPRGMAACLRAGLHLFDCFAKDTNFWLSRGAIKVNLWSGVPLKVFERDIDNPRNRYHRLFHGSLPERWFLTLMMPWHVERPDLIIATADETADITRRAFDVPHERVVVTGFPRNDMLLTGGGRGTAADLPPAFARAISAGQRIFLYLPTFRDNGSRYQRAIDWARLDELMGQRGAKLFCKFHPVARTRIDPNLRHVIELPQSIDVYPLLRHTSALISDYSSIIFDYMLIGQPIVYFTPDLQEFVTGSRRLNFQPADVAVGPMCTNSEELLEALDAIAGGAHPRGPQPRDVVLPRLHSHLDACASSRVLAAIDLRFFGGVLRRAADASAAPARLTDPRRA